MLLRNLTVFFTKTALLGIAVMLTGLHLVFFQCLAWVKMYDQYAQNLPSEIALELILSGQEMCGLCEAVEQARSSVQDGVHAWLTNSGSLLTVLLKPFKKRWSPVSVLIGTLAEYPFPFTKYNFSLDPPPPKVATLILL